MEKNEQLVLAAGPVSDEDQISRDIYKEAVRRLGEKQKLAEGRARLAQEKIDALPPETPLEKTVRAHLEKCVENPVNFQEYATQYLLTNRQKIDASIRNGFIGRGDGSADINAAADFVMDNILYPAVEPRIKFSVLGAGGLMYERGAQSNHPIDAVVLKTLSELYMGLRCAHRGHESYFFEIKASSALFYGKFPLDHFDAMINSALVNGTKVVDIARIAETLRIVLLEQDKRYRGSQYCAEINRRFNYVGSAIYHQVRASKLPNEMIDASKIEDLCNKLVASFTPGSADAQGQLKDGVLQAVENSLHRIAVTHENEPKQNVAFAIPQEFKSLERVWGQIEQYSRYLVSKSQLMPETEELLFGPKRPVTEYQDHLKDTAFPGTYKIFSLFARAAILRGIDKEIFPNVKIIYRSLEDCARLFKQGKTLYSSGATKNQRTQGMIMMEMARVYLERVHEFAVMVDCRLDVRDTQVTELAQHYHSLEELSHSMVLPETFAKRVGAETEFAALAAAETEEAAGESS